jgi:hypothetical protein
MFHSSKAPPGWSDIPEKKFKFYGLSIFSGSPGAATGSKTP